MYDTTPWNLDYVIFRNTTLSTGYMIYFYGASTSAWDASNVAHSFKHITLSDDGGDGYFYFQYGDYSAWILEDWVIDNLEEGHLLYNSSIKFVRLEIKNTDDYVRHYHNGYKMTDSQIHTSKTKDFGLRTQNQPMVVYDTCTFDACDGGVYNFYVLVDGLYLMKNCTFKNATYGMRASDATIMLYGTQTYDTITTEKVWAAGGTFLHVRKMDITVYKPDGVTPLENARVEMRTKLVKTVGSRDFPYEEYSFLTDENGQVKGIIEDSIYLTEKEETGDGVFTQWSDGVSNNVHIITVSHPDYAVSTREIAMTEDRTVTVTMNDTRDTTIYGSTIYGSTIY